MKQPTGPTWPRLASSALAVGLACAGLAAPGAWANPDQTDPPPAGPAAAPAPQAAASAAEAGASMPAADQGKDIVLDTVPPGQGSAVTPVPAPAPTGVPAAAARPGPAPAAGRSGIFNTPVHSAATAATLAELGLDLLRQQSAETGDAQRNSVVSPLSLAAAMGMVHAGTQGAGARELAQLVGTASSGQRFYSARLPALLDVLQTPRAADGRTQAASPFTVANRVWVDRSVASAVPAPYAAMVRQRFGAGAALLSFSKPEEARQAINAWVAQSTAKRIPELMPAGAIKPTTRVVVTNAVHFKSPWARKFDPAATVPLPFRVAGGPPKPVPTMVDERPVMTAVVDNITVYEIPFAGDVYTLMIALPPAGHTLDALETDLAGLDMASWASHLEPKTCRLELPRFSLAPATRLLKPALQAMGVNTVFSAAADFSALLGKAAPGVQLDAVFHAATVTIDEAGGEAAAATGAALAAKSFSLAQPARCQVDRPFVFAIVHKPSGAPLFVGKVADPSLR